MDDARVRAAKKRAHALVEVGEALGEAERRLLRSGFQLMYAEALPPTPHESGLQQVVMVGDPRPDAMESFAYSAGLPWMPWTRRELPVVIDAASDGTITRID